MVQQLQQTANHLSYINEKTIEIFKLYLLPPQFINDLRKVGYMPIHSDRHDLHYIQR